MRRRDVLASAGWLGTGASVGFPAPAIAQGVRQLTMVTDWPENLPGLLPGARRLAETIGDATGGRIKIEVFASGALVRPFESFDAVQAGVADMFHSFLGYFENKSPVFHFWSAIPSSRSSPKAPEHRWAAGSRARSHRSNGSRGCGIGWPGRALKSCAASAPRSSSSPAAKSCLRSNPGRSMPANGSDPGSIWPWACIARQLITTIPPGTSRVLRKLSPSTGASGKALTQVTEAS